MTLEKLDGYHSQRLEKVRVPLRTCAMVAPLGVQHRRGPFRLVRRPRVRQRKIQRPPSRLPAARTGPSSLFAERRLRFLPCAHFGGRVGANARGEHRSAACKQTRCAQLRFTAAVRGQAGPKYRDTKTETRTKKTAPLPAELRYVRPPPNPTHTSSPPLLQARNWAWSVLQFLPLQQQ